MTTALAYYTDVLFTPVKTFIVQDPGVNVINFFRRQ